MVDQATHVLEQGCWAGTEMLQSLMNALPTNGAAVIRRRGEGWRLCHLAIMPVLVVSCGLTEPATVLRNDDGDWRAQGRPAYGRGLWRGEIGSGADEVGQEVVGNAG